MQQPQPLTACEQCAARDPAHSGYESTVTGERVAFCSAFCDAIGRERMATHSRRKHGKHHGHSHSHGGERPFADMDPADAREAAHKGYMHDRGGGVHQLSDAQRRALWARVSEHERA
jgi:hypothetical protein